MRRFVSILLLLSFFMTGQIGLWPVYAQDFVLPKPGVMVHLSPAFNPPILKGIKVHTDNPFRFDFILDKGEGNQNNDQLKNESTKLVKYFLASLTIPEKDLWVNLSPYEKDRIIPESFGLTEMGRDLLVEDYMLKQITASLIYPEDEIGKKFWKRIYEEAQKKYGNINIPVNTFNKVWIVPEKAVVYENAKAGTAYVVDSTLKVMLEQDYLSLEKHEGSTASVKDTNQLGSQITREIVIPELTKEINEGQNFAQLRQVYNSLILATWYKKKIKDSILSQVYTDKNKVEGVNIDDPQEKEKIYEQYLQAFKKGVYSYIKEESNLATGQTTPRKYFSGGITATSLSTDSAMVITQTEPDLNSKAQKVDMVQIIIHVSRSKLKEGYQKPPVAMSFMVADIKFTPDGEVKILEFGQGENAGFAGYNALRPGNNMMALFWDYIAKMGHTIYFSPNQMLADTIDYVEKMAIDHLRKVGSNVYYDREFNYRELIDQEDARSKRKNNFNPHNLATYSGVALGVSNDQIRETNPQILMIDHDGIKITGDKFLTRYVLGRNGLQEHEPRWQLFPTKYNPNIATEVRQAMPAPRYVIKPIDSTRGEGVLVVEAGDLDSVLKRILSMVDRPQDFIDRRAWDDLTQEEASYSFWKTYQNPFFLIEEFETSKPVSHEGKQYDGTMRMAFVLKYDQGKTSVDFLDGYWKLPENPVGEGRLRAATVSKIAEDRVSSAPISPEDKKIVQEQLSAVLPPLYDDLLSQSTPELIDSLLFSDNRNYVAYGLYLLDSFWIQERLTDRQIARVEDLAREHDDFYFPFLLKIVNSLINRHQDSELFEILADTANTEQHQAILNFAEEHRYILEVPRFRMVITTLNGGRFRYGIERLVSYIKNMVRRKNEMNGAVKIRNSAQLARTADGAMTVPLVWTLSGDIQKVPDHFYESDFIDNYLNEIKRIQSNLSKHFKTDVSFDQIAQFVHYFVFTQEYTETYHGKMMELLTALENPSDVITQEMFFYPSKRTALHAELNTYSSIERLVSQRKDKFIGALRKVLEVKKQQPGKQEVKIVVPGVSFGQEAVFWDWIIGQFKKQDPDLGRFSFKIVGFDRNQRVYERAVECLKNGFDLIDAIGTVPSYKRENLQQVFDILKNPPDNSEIKLHQAELPNQEAMGLLEGADIVSYFEVDALPEVHGILKKWLTEHPAVVFLSNRDMAMKSTKDFKGPVFSQYQIAIPQNFRSKYYAPEILEDLSKKKYFYNIQVLTAGGQRSFQIDKSIPQAIADHWKVLYEAYDKAASKLLGKSSTKKNEIKIILVKKSPYLIDFVGPDMIVINEFYMKFLEWVDSEGTESFDGLEVKGEDSDFWARGIDRYRKGDVVSKNGQIVDRNNLKGAFHSLTMPIFFSIIQGNVKWQDLYELFDRIYFYHPSYSLRDEVTKEWVRIPLSFNIGGENISSGHKLKYLWDIWGAFIDDPDTIERFYNQNTAAHHLSYKSSYENRSKSYQKGYEKAIKNVSGYRWTKEEMKAQIIKLRQRGHDLLVKNPELAKGYLGLGKESWAYPSQFNTGLSTQWKNELELLEEFLGAIAALDSTLESSLNINFQKMDEEDYKKSWIPDERLILSNRADMGEENDQDKINHLSDIFKLLSVLRWGIGEKGNGFSLYGMPERTLYDFPGKMIKTNEQYWTLTNLKGIRWKDLQEVFEKTRIELGKKASDEEIVKAAARKVLWKEAPTLDDLRKFIDYLYGKYDKELVRQAILRSFEDFGYASREDRMGTFNPFLMRTLSDAHQIYRDSLWLVDEKIGAELKNNGYPLPWMGNIFGTDAQVNSNNFDGMQIYNVRPAYFDTQLVQVLSEKDPESIDELISFLEVKSKELGSNRYDYDNEKKYKDYFNRTYYYQEPLNYLSLIRQYYPVLFEVLAQRKPELRDTVKDLSLDRRYVIPIREMFYQEKDYMSRGSNAAIEMQGLNIFNFLSVDSNGLISRLAPYDKAMMTGPGGIDLTSNKFLQTQNAGQDIKFQLDPTMLQQLQYAPGFTPVIINIQPLGDLRLFLGLNAASKETAGNSLEVG